MASYLTIASVWIAWTLGQAGGDGGSSVSPEALLERAGITLTILLLGLWTKRLWLGHTVEDIIKDRDRYREEAAMLRKSIEEGHLQTIARQTAALERVATQAERRTA